MAFSCQLDLCDMDSQHCQTAQRPTAAPGLSSAQFTLLQTAGSSMSDNVTVEAVKQAVNEGNMMHGLPSALTSETLATNHADLAQWQQIMQAYYKQPQGQQPAFYPAAAHPYAGFFAGQPMMYGSPFYGGMVPYAYPTPAATALPGSDSTAKEDKIAASQALPAINTISNGMANATLPPRGSTASQGHKLNVLHKTSSNSLSALTEPAQLGKRSAMCTPAANPPQASQATLAEPAKEKTLHAVDTEGIRAEGQAAAMAAIAAAQAQVNGQSRDESRGNVGDYWGRSNSEEDLERADSGDLQDEREVKRQRRKQSNRESARRSRLRKQAECEALAVRVNELMNENVKLRAANEQLLKLQHVACHQGNPMQGNPMNKT